MRTPLRVNRQIDKLKAVLKFGTCHVRNDDLALCQ